MSYLTMAFLKTVAIKGIGCTLFACATCCAFFGEFDWRYISTKQLNDEKAGDILEAIWGLLWHRENQGPLASVIADSLVPTQQLQRYCKCMTRVVLMFVQVWPHFIKSHEWPSSEELANA